ncbi:hypothetical protein KGM_210933 [Danaus plexippus plexippus]|uniref:Uncharacterized protein n=1 Tax=Danaus plexippus plexippus TaxID=278856 RepID=A0A212EML3_DANPL|nr:hypothetical protein KGM_210933 [Danaus plexippus plexippus]
MPRHQKSFDEQYLKEHYTIKEGHGYAGRENYRIKTTEVNKKRKMCRSSVPLVLQATPVTPTAARRLRVPAAGGARTHCYVNRVPDSREHSLQYASSGMLDEMDCVSTGGASADALKTRSLPAFLRPKPRPLSTEDDLHQLYDKVNLSKKYKNRMRSEHAAIIALSKSHSQFLDADAVIVYDQRTAL